MRTPDTVYFARPVGASGPIKIGVTCNLASRLRCMNVDSPVAIECIASTAGSYAEEAQLNRQFAHLNIRGSWFAPAWTLRELIARVAEGAPLGDLIDWGTSAKHPKSAIAQRVWENRRASGEAA